MGQPEMLKRSGGKRSCKIPALGDASKILQGACMVPMVMGEEHAGKLLGRKATARKQRGQLLSA